MDHNNHLTREQSTALVRLSEIKTQSRAVWRRRTRIYNAHLGSRCEGACIDYLPSSASITRLTTLANCGVVLVSAGICDGNRLCNFLDDYKADLLETLASVAFDCIGCLETEEIPI